jgi:RNA polymerase sigma factor (sigma-70 family)
MSDRYLRSLAEDKTFQCRLGERPGTKKIADIHTFPAAQFVLLRLTQEDLNGENLGAMAGDRTQGSAAYARYATALNRYLIKRVGHLEDVADLRQEIFELFVRRKDHTQEVRDPLAYLFRIAFHVVGNWLAKGKRRGAAFDCTRLEELAEACASSAEEAEELVAHDHVRAALAQVPENYLTALLLVEAHGLSYKEAARVSGFTPSTIATYAMRGRAALKVALDHGRNCCWQLCPPQAHPAENQLPRSRSLRRGRGRKAASTGFPATRAATSTDSAPSPRRSS